MSKINYIHIIMEYSDDNTKDRCIAAFSKKEDAEKFVNTKDNYWTFQFEIDYLTNINLKAFINKKIY